MADRYVRSAATGANNGTSWVDAFTTLAAARAAAGAGDRVFVAEDHAEAPGSSTTWNWPGSAAAPVLVICVNAGAEPPTAVETSGTVTASAAGVALLHQGRALVRGLTFTTGGSSTAANLSFGQIINNQALVFEACGFVIANTSAASRFYLGNSASTSNDDLVVEFRNCSFKFGHASQGFQVGHARVRFTGCTIDPAGSAASPLLKLNAGVSVDVLFENCDLSGSGYTLVAVNTATTGRVVFRNCKMPAGWASSGFNAPGYGGVEVVVDDCYTEADGVSHPGTLQRSEYAGVVYTDTGTYGLASDGGPNARSWRMEASAGAQPSQPLRSPELLAWNGGTSEITVGVEVLVYGGTMTDAELWLELDYPSEAATGRYVRDESARVAHPLATPAEPSAGMGTGVGAWTTPYSPVTSYVLEATVTPARRGVLRARVCCCNMDRYVFVDPRLVVE